MLYIQRTESEQIQIKIKEYKDKKYLDIRLWFKSPDRNEYLPTKKGVALPLALLPEFQQIIANLNPEVIEV